MMRPKGERVAAADRTVEPVSRHAVRDPCSMPNSSVRPKGDRAAAAPTEPVSRLLNVRDALHALRDPCRRPNGSVRPKGDRGAAAGMVEKEDPVRRPHRRRQLHGHRISLSCPQLTLATVQPPLFRTLLHAVSLASKNLTRLSRSLHSTYFLYPAC
jgi:hypothetical protein